MPLCACGCNQETKSKWVRGHHSRVSNVSSRPEIKEMRRQQLFKLHAEGRMNNNWNKGLTAQDDERVAAYGKKRAAAFTDEERKKLSESMRERRLNGMIPTLYGERHSQWKGGTSTITQRLRGSALHKEWKYPILSRDGYKCTKCAKTPGKGVKLAVHHDGERFSDIIAKFIPDDKHELDWEEQSIIVDAIVHYHVTNKVSGVTLCYDCHSLVHADSIDSD